MGFPEIKRIFAEGISGFVQSKLEEGEFEKIIQFYEEYERIPSEKFAKFGELKNLSKISLKNSIGNLLIVFLFFSAFFWESSNYNF